MNPKSIFNQVLPALLLIKYTDKIVIADLRRGHKNCYLIN